MTKSNVSDEKFVLTGEIYWAHVHEPNNKGEYPSGKYQCDLSIDKETIDKLRGMGVKMNKNDGVDKGGIKNREDKRGQFVTLTSEYPTRVVDAKKNPIPSSVKIGNGSKVNVLGHAYEGKKGVALGLDAVQVLELVEYVDTTLDAFESVDGYIASDVEEGGEDEDTNDVEPVKVSKDNPF